MVVGAVPVVRWGMARTVAWARTRDREGIVAATLGALSILAMIASLASGEDLESEIKRAAREQRVEAPIVRWIASYESAWKLPERTLAYVEPCQPGAACVPTIIALSDRLRGEDTFRCVARHEVGHVKLGHLYGAKDVREAKKHHVELSFWLKAKYGNGSVVCQVEG